MIFRRILGLLGLFHLINGLTMILAPGYWYATVPGVSLTGPINHHFITDIGLAFVASGAGMLAALRPGRTAMTLALAGTIWPALHALFHIFEWLTDGFPHDAQIVFSEVVGVVAIGLVGITFAFIEARKEGAI
ncbi:MAG TPA: hypothetical protein VIJ85_03165 [Rhizomicrobium sp.]